MPTESTPATRPPAGHCTCGAIRCRMALGNHCAGTGDAVGFVRVGTLDEPDQLPPGMPAVMKYYDRNQFCPATSLERWRILPAG